MQQNCVQLPEKVIDEETTVNEWNVKQAFQQT